MTPTDLQARLSARMTLLSGLHIGERGLRVQIEQTVALLQDCAAALEAIERDRDEWKALAKVGTWHADCRPNRQQAGRELAKSQAIIDKLADTIAELKDAALASAPPASSAEDQHFGSAVRQPDGNWFCVVAHRGLMGSAKSYEGAIAKVQELLAAARPIEPRRGGPCAYPSAIETVDGVEYCGRCNWYVGAHQKAASAPRPEGQEK